MVLDRNVFLVVSRFWAKVPSNCSLCMSIVPGAIEYRGLHVFWLKFIPSVWYFMYENSMTAMENPQPFCQRYSCLN